jgi:hypothetical protein
MTTGTTEELEVVVFRADVLEDEFVVKDVDELTPPSSEASDEV